MKINSKRIIREQFCLDIHPRTVIIIEAIKRPFRLIDIVLTTIKVIVSTLPNGWPFRRVQCGDWRWKRTAYETVSDWHSKGEARPILRWPDTGHRFVATGASRCSIEKSILDIASGRCWPPIGFSNGLVEAVSMATGRQIPRIGGMNFHNN